MFIGCVQCMNESLCHILLFQLEQLLFVLNAFLASIYFAIGCFECQPIDANNWHHTDKWKKSMTLCHLKRAPRAHRKNGPFISVFGPLKITFFYKNNNEMQKHWAKNVIFVVFRNGFMRLWLGVIEHAKEPIKWNWDQITCLVVFFFFFFSFHAN